MAAPLRYLTDQLRAHAARHPRRSALIVDDHPDLRYGEWDRQSEALARGLLDAGLTRGTRIGIYFGDMDWSGYAIAYLGALKAGCAVVHLPTHIPPQELARRAGQCVISGIVHGATAPPTVSGITWSGTIEALSSADATPVELVPRPDDDAEIVYSSGTTGTARGVVVSHQNLATAGGPPAVMAHDEPTPMVASVVLGITASATTISMVLNVTPTTLALAPPGQIDRFAMLIERHRASTVMMTPHLAIAMRRSGVARRYNLTSITTIATASSFLHAPLARDLLAMMPAAQILGAYSASQAKPAVTIGKFDPDRPMSVGRPAPGTHVLITDERGTALPDGQIGRIWLQADGAPKRVRLDDAATDGTPGDGVAAGPGWCGTGDLGHLDSDGTLNLFDRESDVVHTAAGPVSSLRVESVLLDHPAVADAAVVAAGTTTPAAVAAVAAVAVPVADTDVTTLPSRLATYAAGRLATHEIPTAFLLVDDLPRNDLGKVIKRELRGRFHQRVPNRLTA